MRKALASAGIFFASLAGCSGGGGGGGSGGGGGQAALQYTGNANPASITTTNAAILAASATNTAAGSDVAGAFSSAAPGSESQVGQGVIDVGRRLAHTMRTMVTKSPADLRPTAVPVNENDTCSNGGTVNISGDLSPSGIGTVNVTFNNCGEGGDFIAGTATLRIDRATDRSVIGLPPLPTDFTVSFARLALRGSANVDIGGSVRVQDDEVTKTETITENSVVLDLNTGRMTKAETVVVDTFDNFSNPSSFTEVISGRVFDGTHGFVTIATNVPLRFPTLTQLFPSSGELVLSSGNRRIQVLANSTTLVTLGLDLDGVVGFERRVRLGWTDLSGPIGTDLADSDGDGMHNSWETAFGLRPDIDDSGADPDGDGFSNLTEYLGGGNPKDGGVKPIPVVGGVVTVANGVETPSSDSDRPGPTAIASDGRNFLLLSCNAIASNPGIFGVSISPNGEVLNTFQVSNDFCPQRLAVAFDGTNYLVALSRTGQIVGLRVTPSGVVLNPSGDPISPNDGSSNFFPSIAFDGTNYLVAWRKFLGNGASVSAAIVTPAGVVVKQSSVSSRGDELTPRVAFDGTTYLVVWSSGSAGSEDVFGARVAKDGTVLDSLAISIAGGPNSQVLGGVAFDGTNYLVVWDDATNPSGFFPDGQVLGTRVTPAGTLLDGSPIPISAGGFRSSNSSVAFAFDSFLVTWTVGSSSISRPSGIYATRVSKDGNRLDGPPTDLGISISGTPPANSRFIQPVPASIKQNVLIGWINNVEFGANKDVFAAPLFSP